MRRILLLITTTTYRAGAFLDAARRLGVEVTVGSERPQALAAVHPGGHLVLDFLDPVGATRAIVAFARQHPIAAAIAADDDGVQVAAMVSEALGLEHHAAAAVEKARNKLLMRETLREAGLPGPGFRAFALDHDRERAAAEVRYPCVLKPLALSASRGVMRADDAAQFVAAFERILGLLARPEVAASGLVARRILVEDYLPGAEVALEGLVEGGRLRLLALFDKPDPLIGPTFEETIYVTPSRLDPGTQSAVEDEVARVVRALGLQAGPVHAELRIGPDGPRLVEIAPRSIGGLCSRALRFGAGVGLEELILRHALGLEWEGLEREPQASGVMMIPIPAAGVLKDVTGLEGARSVAGIDEIRITVPLGQELVPLPEGARYLGFVFARSDSPERVESALREAHRRMGWVIDPLGRSEDQSRPVASASEGAVPRPSG